MVRRVLLQDAAAATCDVMQSGIQQHMVHRGTHSYVHMYIRSYQTRNGKNTRLVESVLRISGTQFYVDLQIEWRLYAGKQKGLTVANNDQVDQFQIL